MKLALLSIFGLCVAMNAAADPLVATLDSQLQKLQQMVDERAKLMAEFMGEFAEDDGMYLPVQPVVKAPVIGLRTGSLTGASIQSSSGLQSGARGLTPEAEWRRMFPHKPGYSR